MPLKLTFPSRAHLWAEVVMPHGDRVFVATEETLATGSQIGLSLEAPELPTSITCVVMVQGTRPAMPMMRGGVWVKFDEATVARLQSLIGEFNIGHIARQKAFTLSGGERRRVEVARALALDPKFLLLDEPFAGIDPLAVADIQKMIGTLRKRGIGILITDHNVRETLAICDIGYLLSDGKIIEKGTPAEIAQSPIAREKYLGENFQF